MIKKLKQRIIISAMLAVTIVLVSVVGSIGIATHIEMTRKSDAILDHLKNNNGKFSASWAENPVGGDLDRETPYETRFFVVRFLPREILVDMSKIAMISPEEAICDYGYVALEKKAERGFIDEYRYLKYQHNNNDMIIFVDCSNQISILTNYAIYGSILIVFVLLAVLGLLIIFSNRLVKPIAEAYEKQRKFITNASHELKTPLTVITANNELLEMEHGENEYTQNISKQINRLVTMTNSLVALSKIDEQSINATKNNFSLTDATYEIVTEYGKAITQEFKYDIQENVDYVGDERLIRQMLIAVIDNAKKYAKSYINFSLSVVKNQIIISIENDTTGIQEGNLTKYADRFYRSNDVRGSGIEGSGIGLSVVNEVVLLHKGTLKMYSPDGTIFKLEILL